MHIVTKVTSNVGYINAKNILNWLKKNGSYNFYCPHKIV
jgi:hypothetical protein